MPSLNPDVRSPPPPHQTASLSHPFLRRLEDLHERLGRTLQAPNKVMHSKRMHEGKRPKLQRWVDDVGLAETC